MEPIYQYRAVCTRVIDGDTFIARVDLGFQVSCEIRVRLHGVNAPEHNAPGGTEATQYLHSLILGMPILIVSYKDRRSFERWVCDAYIQANDGSWNNISDWVIKTGHGVPFMEGDWRAASGQ